MHKEQIKVLDLEIKKIADNPEIGQEKRGGLKGVRVHKFYISKQLFLLAYEYEADILNLIMIIRNIILVPKMKAFFKLPVTELNPILSLYTTGI